MTISKSRATSHTNGMFFFRQMIQKEEETLAQFITRLRNHAAFCNFRNLEDQIRDQFLQAMMDAGLYQKRLEEQNIKLEDALTGA